MKNLRLLFIFFLSGFMILTANARFTSKKNILHARDQYGLRGEQNCLAEGILTGYDGVHDIQDTVYKNFDIISFNVDQGDLNVFFMSKFDGVTFSFDLYNGNRRVVLSKQITVRRGDNFYKFDVSGLSKGVYKLKMRANLETVSRTINIP